MFPAAPVFVLHTHRVWLSSKMLAGATAKPGGKGKSKGRTGGTCVALEQMMAGPKTEDRGVSCTTTAPVIATAPPVASAALLYMRKPL